MQIISAFFPLFSPKKVQLFQFCKFLTDFLQIKTTEMFPSRKIIEADN
jgi:hypothetical protein